VAGASARAATAASTEDAERAPRPPREPGRTCSYGDGAAGLEPAPARRDPYAAVCAQQATNGPGPGPARARQPRNCRSKTIPLLFSGRAVTVAESNTNFGTADEIGGPAAR